MIVYLGADHQGFKLKELFKDYLKEQGYGVIDVGNDHLDENDDYPDFASAVAKRVSHDHENSRGILICSSGIGMSVVANKYKNVRAAVITNANEAFDSRNDNDANVLTLGAKYLDPPTAKKILITWLQTPFSGEERHRRRLQKLYEIESEVGESYKRGA
jgi:ribose 5-phosphate isomerase B